MAPGTSLMPWPSADAITIRARVTSPARIAVDRDHAVSVARYSSETCSDCVIKDMTRHPARERLCQGINDASH
jgi:hypothetical protein